MTNYREQMIQELELRNLSPSTQYGYLKAMEGLLKFTSKDPEEVNVQDIKNYLHDFRNSNIIRERKTRSASTVNKQVSGILFYYHNILKRHNYIYEIPRMKKMSKNPTILSKEEIKNLISSVDNIMYKAVLMLLYSTGLRQSELRNLKINDIDSERMILNIRGAKGGKDRQAILSQELLDILRKYWLVKANKKSKWIFNPQTDNYHGNGSSRPLSHTAIGYILRIAKRESGISKHLYPHCLRHTFAVHLIEAGTNLRHVQYLMGHADIRSTIRYTYIADIKTVKSPNLLDGCDLGVWQ